MYLMCSSEEKRLGVGGDVNIKISSASILGEN
jgi:hypothetical protein